MPPDPLTFQGFSIFVTGTPEVGSLRIPGETSNEFFIFYFFIFKLISPSNAQDHTRAFFWLVLHNSYIKETIHINTPRIKNNSLFDIALVYNTK